MSVRRWSSSGNGPVGQTAALLLARRGVPVVLLDTRPHRDPIGSRAICSSATSSTSGISPVPAAASPPRASPGRTARTFHRDRELFAYTFPDHGRSPFPPFVNISQARTEQLLDEHIAAEPLIEVRWGHRGRPARARTRRA